MDSNSTERLVRTWMASKREEEVVQIVAGRPLPTHITAGTTTLLNVVKVSGEYLTSDENQIRLKGVELLSLILERLPPATLNRPTTRTLVGFYCNKLEDSETIIPALQGLETLVTLSNFGGPEASTVAEAIIRHVKTKALTQSHRFKVYTIIDALIANHRDCLKSMGLKFLDGYVSLVEGEKDPRNLLVVFAIDKVILIEFDISERVQTFYDLVFCYFPISFRPPPNNPGGITADDLRLALRQCVAATPSFGTLAIPHFLDNLVSGSRVAKRDTLETLTVALPIYGPAVARNFARTLWNSLKLEVFQPVDHPTEEQAVIVIQTLIKTIYSEGTETLDDEIQGLARNACEECLQILQEPEKSKAKVATRLLCSFMTTTPSVSRYTASQAIPHLTKLFVNPDEATSRAATLILLAEFIEAARDSSSHVDTGGLLLAPYKDDILGVLTSGLKAHNLLLPALGGLKGLITTKNLLSDEELRFVVHSVNEVIQDHPDQFEDTRDGVLELLASISDVAPSHIQELTLSLFFSALPDDAPPRDSVEQRVQYWKNLSALEALCTHPQLFETLVIRLSTKLELLCSPSHHPKDNEPSAAYAHAILKTLANVLTVKVIKGHTDVPKYIERLVSRLFNLFVYAALHSTEETHLIATDRRLLDVSAQIITLVVRTTSERRQEAYLKSLFLAFTTGDVAPISEGHFKVPSERLLVLDPKTPTVRRNLIVLFTAAIIPMHKNVDLGISDLNALSEEVLYYAVRVAENESQRTSATNFLAVLLNRKVLGLSQFLQTLQNKFWSDEVANAARPIASREVAVSIWTWISKALLVQNHPLAFQFSERLFEVFEDTNVNWSAAKAVGVIPKNDDVLTKQNHAVKILYAQKYVNKVLPRTIAGAKDSSNPEKQVAHLVALSSLIKSTPKATYASELPSLVPLLIRGLELPDPQIRNNVIETFLAAAEGDSPEKSLISEHASTLVSAMLRNCMASDMPSPKVRISALKYLGRLPGIIKSEVLNRYKSQVLLDLGKVLDDPKRSVRKEAVDAR
ncbi:ARM repeat-containing protein [Coprinopsis marcescibilis]|uniref:MMS19 nucleotide excision repair protein n=1 Tax=Coprinopsis marcescibilis TaxID=230819 RepID=A0A5C3L0A3_COPMA|nr:ARM repeat-containing protein [Coprinopsis marcescibilis]